MYCILYIQVLFNVLMLNVTPDIPKKSLIFIIIPRRVLLERNQLKTSLATTQSIISKLNLSFDPLSRSETVTRSEDILQQAESLNRTCQALCDRLVGNVLLTIVWIRINLAPGSGSKCHNFNFNVKKTWCSLNSHY